MKRKSAKWPFGPRSGQESPTLGAKTSVRLGEPYRAVTQHPTDVNIGNLMKNCNQNNGPIMRSRLACATEREFYQ
jgi:hypothetical protein